MRSHIKNGYSHSDVTDFSLATGARRRGNRRCNAFYLNCAAELRRKIGEDQAKRFRAGDYRTAEDFKRLAAKDALRAREVRLELQGAL